MKREFDFTGWGRNKVYWYLKGCGYDWFDWDDELTTLRATWFGSYDDPVIVHFTAKGRAKKH